MTDSIESQLDHLLSESLSSVIERERSTFDQAAGPLKKSLVLFGAGGNGRKTLAGLRSLGIEPLAFVDNNSTGWNQFIDGLQVLSPLDAVTKFSQEAVFVVPIPTKAWDIGLKINVLPNQLSPTIINTQ